MPDIITDSQLIEQFAKKAMEEPKPVVETVAPSDAVVILPGGLIEPNGEVVTTAEVQELTGNDEELIAKAGSSGKALNILLQRGLVKIGSRQATKEDLDNLLSGDRDAILIGVRRATFGRTIDVQIRCSHCASDQEVSIDLIDDIPIKSLEDPIRDRTWEIKSNRSVIKVALPTGVVHKKLIENSDKTIAEINTMLLSGCVLSVDGSPSSGASTVLALGMGTRNKIVREIIDRNPGPRLGEVKKVCQACGEDVELPLGLTDLFLV